MLVSTHLPSGIVPTPKDVSGSAHDDAEAMEGLESLRDIDYVAIICAPSDPHLTTTF